MIDRDHPQHLILAVVCIISMMTVLLLLIGIGVCSIAQEDDTPEGFGTETVSDTDPETDSAPLPDNTYSIGNSGRIALTPGSAPRIPVLQLRTDYDGGGIYLREKSYGAYNGAGFDDMQPYAAPTDESFLNRIGRTLHSDGSAAYTLELSYASGSHTILSPYYYQESKYPSDDIAIAGDAASYTLSFVPHPTGLPVSSTSKTNQTDADPQELAYRKFVYEHYLELPEDTKAALIAYLGKSALDSRSTVDEIAEFVKQAADYSTDFAPIPADTDVVLYFLEQAQAGICQHFAAAATLIYRALGIPARYVTGYYVSNVTDDEWTDVTYQRAHAWTEIYADGIGWIPMEVTEGSAVIGDLSDTDAQRHDDRDGTFIGFDGFGGFGAGPTTVIPRILELTADSREAEYDGTPLSAQNYTITLGALGMGDTLQVFMPDVLTDVGSIPNRIEQYTITDAYGNDVTDDYIVTVEEGVLTLNRRAITIRLRTDGTFTVLYGSLAQGETFDPVSAAAGIPKITDSSGRDTTENYDITYYIEAEVIVPAELVLRSHDAEKRFDGTPLICEAYDVIRGSLHTGDRLEINAVNRYSDVGTYDNTFTVTVYRTENGKETDVTHHYAIHYQYGTLTITP